MAVYIGSAVCDENGKARGGKAGNQTGKELRVQRWYEKKKWRVFRAKDKDVAERIAKDMEAACYNMAIGYNQSNRNSLWELAEKVGYDCSLVTTPCECDCSSLVRVCVAYGGYVLKNFNTVSEPSRLLKSGGFVEIKKHTDSPDWLMRGDILCTAIKGHTAVVLNDGKYAHNSENIVYVKGRSVRVRTGGSTAYACIGIAHRGDTYPYLGTAASGWYNIDFKGKNGYISNRADLTELR